MLLLISHFMAVSLCLVFWNPPMLGVCAALRHSVMSDSRQPHGLSSPGSSVHKDSSGKKLEWVALSSSRVFYQPRGQTQVSCFAHGFFITYATREAHVGCLHICNCYIFFWDWSNDDYAASHCIFNSLYFSVYFFPHFFFISWRLITLQYCSGFCHTLTWISHGFTCIPHPDPPSLLPLYPIPLGLPSAPGPSTCLMHPTWAGDLFWLIRVLLLQCSFFFLISSFMTFFLLSPQFQSAYAPRSKVDLL